MYLSLIKGPELCQLASTHCFWFSVNVALLSDEYKTACFGNQASLGSLVLILVGGLLSTQGSVRIRLVLHLTNKNGDLAICSLCVICAVNLPHLYWSGLVFGWPNSGW